MTPLYYRQISCTYPAPCGDIGRPPRLTNQQAVTLRSSQFVGDEVIPRSSFQGGHGMVLWYNSASHGRLSEQAYGKRLQYIMSHLACICCTAIIRCSQCHILQVTLWLISRISVRTKVACKQLQALDIKYPSASAPIAQRLP